jgi:hypothetical protein
VSLSRQREAAEVALIRHELTDAEQKEFLAGMHQAIHGLSERLKTGAFATITEVPAGADVIGRLKAWLSQQATDMVAATPRL